jgi:hypothetical protein
MFVGYLPARNIRYEEDLVDQLFNSSEKRLARVLLLLAHFGKEGKAETVIPKMSQETLAEMIGTTRSRVSFFMNRFRKLVSSTMTAGVGFKSTVHSSTSFSTTRTSFRKRGMLSRRHSHPRLRHFLSDFGECRFILLLFCFCFCFPFTHNVGLWIGVDKMLAPFRETVKI